jgi:hypothetical protein
MQDDARTARAHRRECSDVFRRLLRVRRGVHHNACVFVRELSHTSHCDAYLVDFAVVRQAYHDRIGEDGMHRIATFDETEQDQRRAAQAVAHHYDWTQRALLKARYLQPFLMGWGK